MNLIELILEGHYSPDGRLIDHIHSRRRVTVDLENEDERGDIQWFFNTDTGENCWGLGNEEIGWWKIVETFEIIEPNEEVHENKYPVAYHLDESGFSRLVAEANEPVKSKQKNIFTLSEPECGAKPTVYAAILDGTGPLVLQKHLVKAFTEGFVRPIKMSSREIDEAIRDLQHDDYAWIGENKPYLAEVTRMESDE